MATAIAPWRRGFRDARWAPPENWHLTMKFLGATRPSLVGWVGEQIHDVATLTSPFETRVTGLGAFPSPARARILWAAVEDDGGWIARLGTAIEKALERRFEPERRAFRAHVTIGRSDPPLRLPDRFVSTPIRTEPFVVDRLVLFRSHLLRPPPRYEVVGEYPFGG